jgi:hypothetical protein
MLSGSLLLTTIAAIGHGYLTGAKGAIPFGRWRGIEKPT